MLEQGGLGIGGGVSDEWWWLKLLQVGEGALVDSLLSPLEEMLRGCIQLSSCAV